MILGHIKILSPPKAALGTQQITKHKSALLLCLCFGVEPLRTPVLTLLTSRAISPPISGLGLSPGMLVPVTPLLPFTRA